MVKECLEVEVLRSTNKNHAGNERRKGIKKNITKRGCENGQGRRVGYVKPVTLEDKGQQEEGPENVAQARLTLQHEFERMATARAENVALEFDANSEIMLAMEASKEAYGAEGEKARKTSGDQLVQGAPRRKETRRDVQDAGVSIGGTGGETEERTGWSCGSLEGAVPRNSAASSTDNAHHGQASRERQRHEGPRGASMSNTKTSRNNASCGFWLHQLTQSSCTH